MHNTTDCEEKLSQLPPCLRSNRAKRKRRNEIHSTDMQQTTSDLKHTMPFTGQSFTNGDESSPKIKKEKYQ